MHHRNSRYGTMVSTGLVCLIFPERILTLMQGKKSVFFAGCLTGFLTPMIILGIAVALMIGPYKSRMIDQMAEKLHAPAITTGATADFNWTVTTADGETLDPNTWLGKPAFISFWDPSCPHCLAELPSMESLYQQARGMDMTFAAVALENGDDAFEYMLEQGYQIPVYALEGELPPVFEVSTKPTTFIVGHNGSIVFKQISSAKWDDVVVLSLLQDLNITEAPATE